MKKIYLLLLTCFIFNSVEFCIATSQHRRPHRAFDFDEDDDFSFLHSRRTKEASSILESIRKINAYNDSISLYKEKLKENGLDQTEKNGTLKLIAKLERERDALLNPEVNDALQAIRQGITRGLLGRSCSADDSIHYIFLQAFTEKSTAPLGKVITKRSEKVWNGMFDKIESGIQSLAQLFGFSPTISINDINRWQTRCADLADAYKELRKGIENSETRATSMQLRSMLTESFDDSPIKEKTENQKVVDPAWTQRRKGDLIFLNVMLEKCKIRLDEVMNDIDIQGCLQGVISDIEGLIDQIKTANCLQDLIDSNRTQLMTNYFASINSGLTELGMIVDPENFGPKNNRKKTSSFGGGYGNYDFEY